jgi:hypothetical protein
MSWQALLDPNEHAVAGDVTPVPSSDKYPDARHGVQITA